MRKSLLYFSLLIVVILLLLRPVTVYTLDTYLSSLLETEVKVTDMRLFERELQATVKNENNLVFLKINALFPFQADFSYKGNADAFALYQPVKALTELRGKVYYKDDWKINAELTALGAKSVVEVKEENGQWEVLAKISHLDLSQLKAEHNLSADISGFIEGEVDFHTNEDSTLTLTSGAIKLENEELRNIKLQISKAEEDIYAWTTFDAKAIEYKGVWFHYDQNRSRFDGKIDLLHRGYKRELIVNLEGERTESQVHARVDIDAGDSHIDITDIVYDNNSGEGSALLDIAFVELSQNEYLLKALGIELRGDFSAKGELAYRDKVLIGTLHSQSLGGDLEVAFQDESLQWKAKSVELEKILYLLGSDERVSAKLDTQGKFHKNNIDAKLSSTSVAIAEEEIKNLRIALKGPLEKLDMQMHLETPYANIEDTDLRILDLKNIKLESNLTTPYTSEYILLEADAFYSKALSSLELNATSSDFSLALSDVKFKEGRLAGNYKALIESKLSGLKERLHLDGGFSYDKVFTADMKSQVYGGNLTASMSDKNVSAKASGLRLERLLDDLKQPIYATGVFDANAEGTMDKLDFRLSSDNLSLGKRETGLDENLSVDIIGEASATSVLLFPTVKNRYVDTEKGKIAFGFTQKNLSMELPLSMKKEENTLDLLLDVKAELQEDLKADVRLSRKEDSLSLDKLLYKDQNLHSELSLDIKELNEYQELSGHKLYGPLKLTGVMEYAAGKPKLFVTTDSFEGKLDILLKDKDLKINLDHLSTVEVGRVFKKRAASRKGHIDGTLTYNFENKKGYTELSARDVEIQGIDIDKSIRELHDMLGLNVYAVGRDLLSKRVLRNDDTNLSTQIEHIELDAQITPELIISKDIAMATKESRFAINTRMKHNGDIEEFKVAILDSKGCAILTQRLTGNIKDPKLANTTGTAVVVLGQAPQSILNTGGKILDAGAAAIDSTASFIWEKALRQNSKVTLVQDVKTKGANVFAFGKEILVSGECKRFYKGKVKHPK